MTSWTPPRTTEGADDAGAVRPLRRLAAGTLVIAAAAAVLGALSGIALGSWLAWRSVDPLAPDESTTLSLAQSVLPVPVDPHVEYYMRSTFWNPYSNHTLHGGTGVRAGRARVSGTVPPNASYEEVSAAIQGQLGVLGWHGVHTTVQRYGPTVRPSAVAEVTGVRAGYLVSVQVGQGDENHPGTVWLSLMRAEPPGHLRDTVIGGLAGALFGALFGLYSSKLGRRGRTTRRVYRGLCLATLLLLAPACLGNIPTSTGSLAADTFRDGTGPAVYWGGFVTYGAEPLAILSLLPILAILFWCVWPRRAPGRTAPVDL